MTFNSLPLFSNNSNSEQNLILHLFKTTLIEQAKAELIINGVTIPFGYVNISQMCLAKKKRLNDYLTNKYTLSYFAALCAAENLAPPVAGILPTDNSNTFSNAKEYGAASGLLIELKDAIGGIGSTYAHPEVAIDVASWADVEFKVWANKVLRAILNKEYSALTENAAQIESKLQKTWGKLRKETKVVRRTLTDAIKDWLIATPEECNQNMYAIVTNELYMGYFGKTAQQMRQERNVATNDLLRDSFEWKELNEVERREEHAAKLIDKKKMHPIEAIKQAVDFHS